MYYDLDISQTKTGKSVRFTQTFKLVPQDMINYQSIHAFEKSSAADEGKASLGNDSRWKIKMDFFVTDCAAMIFILVKLVLMN